MKTVKVKKGEKVIIICEDVEFPIFNNEECLQNEETFQLGNKQPSGYYEISYGGKTWFLHEDQLSFTEEA